MEVVAVDVAGLFPVRPDEPVQAAAWLGLQAQLVGPSVDVLDVIVILDRWVTAAVGRRTQGYRRRSIGRAGRAIIGLLRGRVEGRTRVDVLHVFRVLVHPLIVLGPPGIGVDQIADADVALEVKIQCLGVVRLIFRSEAHHVVLAQGVYRAVDQDRRTADGVYRTADAGILVPGTVGLLSLIAAGQSSRPVLCKFLADRETAAG